MHPSTLYALRKETQMDSWGYLWNALTNINSAGDIIASVVIGGAILVGVALVASAGILVVAALPDVMSDDYDSRSRS